MSGNREQLLLDVASRAQALSDFIQGSDMRVYASDAPLVALRSALDALGSTDASTPPDALRQAYNEGWDDGVEEQLRSGTVPLRDPDAARDACWEANEAFKEIKARRGLTTS